MPVVISHSVPRLLTPRFGVISISGMAYFIGFTALYPVLPRYVESLGGSGLAVGMAVGSFGITAALLRPVVGRIGDRYGRRVLVMGGMAIVAVALVAHLAATTVAVVIGLRLLFGVGEAAAFVGLATAIQDLAPTERRAEAASYFSVSVYGGIALGPMLGNFLVDRYDYELIWIVLAAIVVFGVVLGLAVPSSARASPRGASRGDTRDWWRLGTRDESLSSRTSRASLSARRDFIHREAVWPGLALGAAMVGYAGFVSFITLLIDDRGTGDAGLAFTVYALLTLAGRVSGAKLGDRVGEVRVAAISLVTICIGLITIAAWSSEVGLYVGIVGLAAGMALNFPALLALVTRRASEEDRTHAIASFVMFFDLAFGLGALVIGVIVGFAGRPAGIAVGGLISLCGLPALVKANQGPRDEVASSQPRG